MDGKGILGRTVMVGLVSFLLCLSNVHVQMEHESKQMNVVFKTLLSLVKESFDVHSITHAHP